MPEQFSSTDSIHINEQDEIQHILGHPPGWILRWGITIIFLLVGIFLALGWMIKYPDIVPARVLIVGEKPAIRVVAQVNGKIDQLLVADQQRIDSGTVLAIIDDAANWSEVRQLRLDMEAAASITTPTGWLTINPKSYAKLGEMQYSYASFQQRLRDFQYFLRKDDVQSRVNSLKQQQEHLEKLNENISLQKSTLENEKKLTDQSFERDQKLYSQGLISMKELEVSTAAVLNFKRRIEALQTDLLDNQIRSEQLKTQIIEIEQNRTDGKSEKVLAIKNDVQRILGELRNWEQRYLMIAPISGQVSMSRIWSPQQFVQSNEEVFAIVPHKGQGAIQGKAILPIANSGKVKSGMRVNIRLDGYPYQEFGVVKGTVKQNSLVPEENNYLLEINLPDSLTTTYNHKITFSQEMQGTAHIITEDRRFLERIFDKVLSILRNN